MSDSPDPQPTLLHEPDPKSLDALFSEDPEGLSEDEFLRVVMFYRQKRLDWQKAEAEGATRARTTKAKAPAKPIVSIDDLEL